MAEEKPTTTTLRTANDYFVCAESGGGREVMVDRPEAGPWETWTVTKNDDGTVSLQAHDGHFLTAELDGSVMARATESGAWERFEIEVRDDEIVAFKSAHGTYLQAAEGGGPGLRLRCVGDDPNLPGEWEFFVSSTKFWKANVDLSVCRRPLIGPLRIQDKLFRDDTGYRRVLFCSWFPALRILRDNPDEFYRQLNSITAAGFQGIRVFLAVGGWDDYWNGREVAPITFVKWFFTGNHLRTDEYSYTVEAWPDYDDLLRTLLRECVKRKLRLHVTNGDMQVICPDPNEELDLHRRYARICAEEGGLDVIALAETTNEYPLNRAGGDSDESIEQMGHILDIWSEAIPGVLTAIGANPANEEPDSLYRASTFGNTCAVHVSRDPFSLCLKRTLGLVYWEGDYRAFPKPYWEGEPAGPGPDSYCQQDNPANLVALHAMIALTGQADNWFQGAAVRSFEPLESEWGFLQIASLLAILPEDVATWEHKSNEHGGVLYWFKDKKFFTVVYEDWDPSPPFPIKDWVLITGTEVITSNGKKFYRGSKYTGAPKHTGLLMGTFQ